MVKGCLYPFSSLISFALNYLSPFSIILSTSISIHEVQEVLLAYSYFSFIVRSINRCLSCEYSSVIPKEEGRSTNLNKKVKLSEGGKWQDVSQNNCAGEGERRKE